MNTGAANGSGRGRQGPAGVSAAARVRTEGDDFSASFAQLQEEVRRACALHSPWEARVVAALESALDFVSAHPGKAKALTVNARRPQDGEGEDPERAVIAYFAARLGDAAPAERRFPISTDVAIVESIATIVRGHLVEGTTSELPKVGPDLVYLSLMPYVGFAEARRWASSATAVGS